MLENKFKIWSSISSQDMENKLCASEIESIKPDASDIFSITQDNQNLKYRYAADPIFKA